MVFKGLDALARSNVPQLDGLVFRGAEERGVGHLAYTHYPMRMPLEGLEALARGDVPQVDGLVFRGAEEGGGRH